MLGLCGLAKGYFCQTVLLKARDREFILCATSMSARGKPSGVRRLVFMSTPCCVPDQPPSVGFALER